MLKNYFTIALRNILKHKTYSFINIIGLAIGMAACLVIYIFIDYETSFDAFHAKKQNIYRLDEVQTFPGTMPQKVALSMPGMGPNLIARMPEIIDYSRFWGRGKRLYKKNDQQIMIEKSVMVDSSFLSIFDFEMIQGDRKTALDEPNSLVITEESALKIFNKIDVLGETITFDWRGEDREGKITGILENVPLNSHLQFDVLISMSTAISQNPEFNDQFGSNYLVTYFVLDENTNIPNLESKFPDFMVSKMNEDINDYYKLYLQPLSEVHLGSTDMDHDYHNWGEFDRSYVKIFSIMAVFVLVIAAINFMNLTTARSITRSKEISLRKSIGAKKNQIINQFLGESILFSLFSAILALILGSITIPLINDITSRPLSLFTALGDPVFLGLLILVVIVLGLLSGIYPALVMSSFSPIILLKGKLTFGGSRSGIQNIMVVGQFAIGITLIIGTFIAIQQFNYMKNKDIGFNKEQVMLIPLNNQANEQYETLKNEISNQSGVLGVTAAGQRIGNNFHQWGFRVKTDTTVFDLTVSNVNVDYDYFEVYNIPLVQGRGFSKDYTTDAGFAFVVNKALLEELNLTDPLGRMVGHGNYHEDSLGTIIGVTDNFNFNSLHHDVNTLVISLHPDWGYEEMSVKISPDNMQSTIQAVGQVYDKLVTNRPFEYQFLDEHFDRLYAADEQMSRIVPFIAILSVIIACLGLFGLSTFTIEQRIKEIGIRKVLGASISQLFTLLSRKFVLLILVAYLMAIPVSFYLMNDWLANFAFHINIGMWVYVVTGILSLFIALGTISVRTINASLQNPAKTLKYE